MGKGLDKKYMVGGNHYVKHDIQPWDIIDAYGLDFYAGNALKYILRHRDKNGLEDLLKAQHYLEAMIEREKDSHRVSGVPYIPEKDSFLK